MTKKERAREAISLLAKRYPDPQCSLSYKKPYELLISVRLAAQCTDARVNIVCVDLFKKYPDLRSFAEADITELEAAVKPCGYYHQKAKNIIACAQMLIENYGGVIPSDMDELLKLPGVGRKTANLILGDVYKMPSCVVADTHCIRISGRLGLSVGSDPAKVEAQLRPLLPPDESNDFCHRLVLFGREICTARSPKCAACPLIEICPSKML